jgi:hypothetical protein
LSVDRGKRMGGAAAGARACADIAFRPGIRAGIAGR